MRYDWTPLWRSTVGFDRLFDLGAIRADIELIRGALVEKMPQSPLHASIVELLRERLEVRLPEQYFVRQEKPLTLADSEPEPDVAVVKGSRASYRKRHPRNAVLIVEVSDTTLHSDRARKASLYARAGVPDFWIVNLVDRRLEVYRTPQPDPTRSYGHGYAAATILTARQSASPLAAPKVSLAVADLLP